MHNAVFVDLSRLQQNFKLAQSLTPDKTVIAVVKADAYGHGALRCAKTLYDVGCRFFAVADLWEAVALRAGGLYDCEILILGATPPDYAEILCRYRLTQSVHSSVYAQQLEAHLSQRLHIHLKFDSGMHRFGFPCTPIGCEEARRAASLSHLYVRGIFSHLALGDAPRALRTRAQVASFAEVVDSLQDCFDDSILIHLCNSDAVCARIAFGNAVRLGILLYGYPSAALDGIAPILTWQSKIVDLRTVPAGEWVGYGTHYRTNAPALLATVPIGYADGFARTFVGASFPCGACRATVAGVCMDAVILSLPIDAEVCYGQTVTILGNGCDAKFWASHAHTIPYEILCRIGARQRRIYRTKP